MKKTSKIIILLLICSLSIASIFFLFQSERIRAIYRRELSVTPAPTIQPPNLKFAEEEPILRVGSIGVDVLDLQQRLLELGYYNAEVDGQFGPGTKEALIRFQEAHSLDADGIAGKQTLHILYSENAKKLSK